MHKNGFLKSAMVTTGLLFVLSFPRPARADLFGGDVAVLTQILANAVQQLAQLQQIVGTSADSLEFMRELNRGIREGLRVVHMVDPNFKPGLFGNLDDTEQIIQALSEIYGVVPKRTPETGIIELQDRSAAESIAMNKELYEFADQTDAESKRIFEHSQDVSPQGAAKLTAQSLAVLISVSTQVLRTNSMMLKMMGQNMASSNRRGKLQAEQFRTQFSGMSKGLKTLKDNSTLAPIKVGL